MKRVQILLILLPATRCDSLYFRTPEATTAPSIAAGTFGPRFTPPPRPPAELLKRDSTVTYGSVLYGYGTDCAYENGQRKSVLFLSRKLIMRSTNAVQFPSQLDAITPPIPNASYLFSRPLLAGPFNVAAAQSARTAILPASHIPT
jgi:hypothetical protein